MRILLLLSLVLCGCVIVVDNSDTKTAAGTTQAAASKDPPSAPPVSDEGGKPQAPAGPAGVSGTETHHGYEVKDPFRYLETEEGARQWLDRENAATRAFFEKLDGSAIEERLRKLGKLTRAGRARTAGERMFFSKREPTEEQFVLYVRDADGKQRPLIDPAKLDAGGKVALDWYHPSPKGNYVAYGLSRDGSEKSVLHVLQVGDAKVLDLRIEHTRAASVAWLPDESGFYYTQFPGGDPYTRHVYFHKLGGGDDVYVFGKDNEKTDWPDIRLSPDGDKLLIMNFKGWKLSEVWTLDRPSGTLRKILSKDLGALFGDAYWVDGRILTTTNHEAPQMRVVSIDPENPAPAQWKTVVAERGWPIDSIAVAGDRLALVRNVKAVSRLEVHKTGGGLEREIDLPGLGAIYRLTAQQTGARFLFSYVTHFTPSAIYELAASGGEPRVLHAPKGGPDTSMYEVRQVQYPSYDGTWVPMFLLQRKGLKFDGSHPTLLYGYGGFGLSETPYYSTNAIFWLERGGVYAVANLRGGGEKGDAWHDGGRLGNKHQVFRDFEYAMRYLVGANITRPDRLVIRGGSNGGLLMGAMMTQAPELFEACVGQVGLYDMIRFHKFPPAEWWVDEYGSSDDAEQVGYLLGYSPYHQVVDGVDYPAFLGTTGREDSRVTWVHTAKFVARLQQATSGVAPILFFREEKAGHGQGKGRSDRLKEDVMTWEFILSQLGMLEGAGS